jgi:hypothetical protein
VLQIPRSPGIPSAEIYDFLYSRLSTGGTSEVNALLIDYLRRQREMFGDERVWAYRARAYLGRGIESRAARVLCAGVFLSGLIWFGIGALGAEYSGWLGGGIFAALFGGLFYGLFWFDRARSATGIKNWRDASLVISPAGLALVQGDIQGELSWEELRDVRLVMRRASAWSEGWAHPAMPSHGISGPGLKLRVEGAEIFVADIYDRPLALIHEKIMHYWRPEKP